MKNPKITGRPSRFSAQAPAAGARGGLTEICRGEAMVSIGTVYNWLHHYPQFARDYGRAGQVQALLLESRSADLVLSTGPGGYRRAEKVLAQMRQRMAVLSAKAWDPGARPRAISSPRPVEEKLGEES